MLPIREKISRCLLKNKLKKTQRNNCAKNFHLVQKVGLLFTYEGPQKIKRVKQYMKNLRAKGIKEVSALGYADAKKIEDHFQPFLGLDILTKKDVNYFFRPTVPPGVNFMNEPFDYLFVIEKQLPYPLEYVLAISPAHLKIGFQNSPQAKYFDFMLSGELSTEDLLLQSEKYLSKVAES